MNFSPWTSQKKHNVDVTVLAKRHFLLFANHILRYIGEYLESWGTNKQVQRIYFAAFLYDGACSGYLGGECLERKRILGPAGRRDSNLRYKKHRVSSTIHDPAVGWRQTDIGNDWMLSRSNYLRRKYHHLRRWLRIDERRVEHTCRLCPTAVYLFLCWPVQSVMRSRDDKQ